MSQSKLNNPENLIAMVQTEGQNFSLPQKYYRDPEIYQADLQSIFYRCWIYAGHISQLNDRGDYFLTEFGDESIIICKGKDDQIRAFANVCRHRGSRVCLEQKGKVNAFVCPYHAWTYDLDGALKSRRSMGEDFDREPWGLKSIKLELVNGLIFINLDDDAPDFSADLDSFKQAIDIYQVEKTKVAHQATFSVDANWKLAIENFLECYHCTPAHPEYSCSHTLNNPKDYDGLRPAMLEEAKALGYEVETRFHGFEESVENHNNNLYFYNRSALYDGYVTGSKNGKPLAPLLGKIKGFGGGAADIALGPVTYAIFYADHIVLYRFLATGLQTTDMEIIWLVNESAEPGKDFDLEELIWLWTITTEADKKIIHDNQSGVNSKYYEPGPLSQQEYYLTLFNDWYFAQLKNIATK